MDKFLIFVLCVINFVTICVSDQKSLQDADSYQVDSYNSEGYVYTSPPNNDYLPPKNNYLPPNNNYLPPVYGPPVPPHFHRPPGFSFDSHENWLLHKIKTKINLFTAGKILLKIIIFKKIVKFIGIICLLLFLPKLKDMFGDMSSSESDTENRQIILTDKELLERRINELSDFTMKFLKT